MLERTPAAVLSTSMDKQNRLSIMKKAVDTVLQTLTLSDTIAVVAFSDSAEQVMSICCTCAQARTHTDRYRHPPSWSEHVVQHVSHGYPTQSMT